MDPQHLERISPIAWLRNNTIVNEKGKRIRIGINSPHFFMLDLYEDDADEIAVQKPSQIGVSTWAIIKTIHSARFYGINQIHTLPTGADVGKFVPSKVNEIIKRNPSIKMGMKEKEVDAVAQKQFGKAFIYYKGTFSERESLMLSSDVNWYDELDKSDQGSIAFFESRLEGADSLRRRRYISTPTAPNIAINKKFMDSDQRHWRFNCQACDKEQHMSWPENVSFERKCYVCSHCDEPLDPDVIRKGRWKAKFPAKKMHGYQLTQMICPWISAEDMIAYYEDAQAGRNEATMEYFYNHKLGLPYVSASSRVTGDLVLRNISSQDHQEIDSIMGVDVQETELYCILGTLEGVYGIIRIQDTPDKDKWDRWAELMEVYDVRYCVIDGGYKPNDSVRAAERFPGKVWVNWYKDDPKKERIIRWNDDDFQSNEENRVRVLTERDRMIDWMLDRLMGGTIRFYYSPYHEDVKLLIAHMETTYARTVTDRIGKQKREWISTGKDDLFHALVYYFIARERRLKNER